MNYYAHSLEGQPPEKWQALDNHLQNVAELAECFADTFGSGEWGRLAGSWHDLSKSTGSFANFVIRKK